MRTVPAFPSGGRRAGGRAGPVSGFRASDGPWTKIFHQPKQRQKTPVLSRGAGKKAIGVGMERFDR